MPACTLPGRGWEGSEEAALPAQTTGLSCLLSQGLEERSGCRCEHVFACAGRRVYVRASLYGRGVGLIVKLWLAPGR